MSEESKKIPAEDAIEKKEIIDEDLEALSGGWDLDRGYKPELFCQHFTSHSALEGGPFARTFCFDCINYPTGLGVGSEGCPFFSEMKDDATVREEFLRARK